MCKGGVGRVDGEVVPDGWYVVAGVSEKHYFSAGVAKCGRYDERRVDVNMTRKPGGQLCGECVRQITDEQRHRRRENGLCRRR